jgi:outer membrane immunogenic protein
MRKRLFGAAVATVLTATLAAAAEYGSQWRGAYIGGNFGYQWDTVTNSGADPAGFSGGGQVGYDWQIGQFVIGLETDLHGAAIWVSVSYDH